MTEQSLVLSIDAHVGERLRRTRLVRGRSIKELAALVGVTELKLCAYERGRAHLPAAKLLLLAAALGVPFITLFH
jgi:transcriptional regulator with XRE-family HTH domain